MTVRPPTDSKAPRPTGLPPVTYRQFQDATPTEPCPDPSQPYIWLDGKWWLLASDRQDAPLREAERRMREYSDDEPRDDHGRWTSGSAGGNELAVGPAPGTPGASEVSPSDTPVKSGDVASRVVGKPGVGTQWTPAEVRMTSQAVNDAVAAHPELAPDHPNGLQSVSFASQVDPPPGFSPDEWEGTRYQDLFDPRGAVGAITYSEAAWNGSRIVLNDTMQYPTSTPEFADAVERGLLNPASETAYGETMHEIGHAWAVAHGVTDGPLSALALDSNGITPRRLAEVSRYAASAPQEGIAELFAVANTPGFSLPGSLPGDWAKMASSITGNGTPTIPESPYLEPPHGQRLILTSDAALAEIERAAAENIRANAWVARMPLYDQIRGGGKREIRESVGRMAEYSDDEPRDYHGRWTTGGGGDGGSEDTAALQTEPTTVAASGSGQWTAGERQNADEALRVAVAKWPELSNGPRPWAGMGWASSTTPPPGVPQGEWDALRAKAIQDGADGYTGGLSSGDRTYTVLNDAIPFEQGTMGQTMPSDNVAYGTAMHEIGHAWAAANGFGTAPEIAGAMTAAGIGPRDILNAGSRYGAADAREGFAELFSQANTPGYYLPRFLGERFDNLMGIMRSGSFGGTDYSGPAALELRPLVKRDGPLTPHIEASADRNLRANAWVSYVPELMRESVGRLREYDDSEPRDDHGRWSGGGGGASTLTAHPGDQSVQDLAGRAFASPALSTAQITAIANYQTGNYAVLNGELRSGSGSADAATITDAISGSHTTEPTTVYRGLGDPAVLGSARVGDSITDHGIISTSLSGYEAGMFTGYGDSFADASVLAEIHLPTGTPALALATAMPHNASGEAEVLLAPGSTFNVDAVRSDADVASGQPRYVLSYAR